MKAVWRTVSRTLYVLLCCVLVQHSVTAQLRTSFMASPAGGCAPVFVHFTDISTGSPTSWKWDLGNGTVSYLQNPSTTYFTPGRYSIKLVISNGNNADSLVKTNYIVINDLPKPLFKASDSTGCYPLKTSFADLSLAKDGSLSKWEWDFGDGTLSTQQSPIHAYADSGSYNVSLRVTNSAGCIATLSKPKYITIKDGVKASFAYTGSSQCTPPSIIHFTNKSTGTGTLSYKWIFGDGNTSTEAEPANTYMNAGLYSLQLIVKNNVGCIDTLVKKDSIAVGVAKAIINAPDTVCQNNLFQAFNASKPATGNLLWSFGNGVQSAEANPFIQYAAGDTTYTISLLADFGSCKDSTIKKIKVIARASANFSADKTATCKAPFTVQFSNKTTAAIKYQWFFGDNTSSTSANPSHTYTTNGSYDVTLVVTNSSGCTDTVKQAGLINIVPAEIKIDGLPLVGCAPLTFRPTYTVVSVVPLVSYNWNFGDGSSATAAKPVHVYALPGVYTVSLTYTTADGCTGTVTYTDAIKAGQKPGAAFTVTPTNTCASTPVIFNDNSTGKVTEWLWSFGDGIIDTARNSSHLYTDTGYFSIRLIVSNNGCADTLVKPKNVYIKPPIAKFATAVTCQDPFHFSFSNFSIGAGSWTWDFGDGTGSSQKDPVHVYTSRGSFVVKLTVNNGTCSHTSAYRANVVKETADFTASRTVVCKGDSIALQAGGFNPSNVINYLWSLDERVDTARSIRAAYTKSGLHTISLIITNVNGCTDTMQKVNYIAVNGPTADFDGVKNDACLNLGGMIRFADAAATDGTHPIKKWQWSFGDGASQSYSSLPFTHVYNAEGYYSVGLKVTDSEGCSDSISKTNKVYIANPRAVFDSPDSMSCSNKPIVFSNRSSGQSLVFNWAFGDNSRSADPNPVHNYALPNTYDAFLKVTDQYGCADSSFKKSYIHIEDPKARFLVSDSASTCPPLVVNFSNQSKYYQQYGWDFGDATAALVDNPVHYYNYPGTYRARLVVTSFGGCTDTIYKKIDIKGPTGTFSYDKTASCNPGTINFTAQTQNAQSFIWDFNDGGTTNTGDAAVNHQYTALGVFVPKMILQDDKGCKVPVAGKDTIRIYGVRSMFSSNTTVVCDNGLVNFKDSSISNDLITSYQWQTGDSGMETEQNPGHQYSTTGIYPVKLLVTTLNGCKDSTSRAAMIKVVSSPKVLLRGDLSACAPATLSFFGDVTVADTSKLVWQWDFTGNRSSNVQNPAPVNFMQDGTYPATLKVTNSSGCVTTQVKDVVIHPVPLVSAGRNTAICERKTATLEATGADKYAWSPATSLSCTNCTAPVAAPDSTITYKVHGETIFGCTADNAVQITVKHPFRMQVGQGDTLCKGESFRLQAKNAEVFNWIPSASLDHNNTTSPLARPDQTTNYQVIGRDSIGCFYDTGYIRLTVYNFPTVDLGPDKTMAVGSSMELNAKVSKDATVLRWEPSVGLSCTNCANPTANPKTTTSYRLMAINEGGCINKDELTVFVICNNGNIFLPNTFSPNGNGTNDVFYPRGTGLYNIKSMKIFNRWGEPVFEAGNFKANDASHGWNGSFKGKPAPNDVYVYYVEVVCENNSLLTYSGNIALIR